MLLVPQAPAWSDEAREDNHVMHIPTFSDGRPEKTISFSHPGTDKNSAITIPHGAEIVSASMNVSSLPFTDGGDDYPENVTVDLGNDGSPEWAFQGKGYGQMGHQTLFSNEETSINISLPRNGTTNASATIRLPKNANITSAKMDVKGWPSRILCVYADKDPNYVNDPVTKLNAMSNELGPVDKFDGSAGTPTLDMLMGYSACLLWTVGYSGFVGYATWLNSAGMGNVMADYVDLGGGVVTLSYCWHYSYGKLGGRWDTGGYSAVSTNSSGMVASGSSINIGTILQPNHPIMKNVRAVSCNPPSGSNAMWLPSETASYQSAVNGGSVVFSWSYSSIVGACVKTMPNNANRVDIVMQPWSDSVAYRGTSGGQGYSGDGNILIKNSLLWTGNPSSNFSVDVTNDGLINWMNPSLNGTEAIPDFASELNSYLAKATPNGTDLYGNEYVDVPVAVSSNRSNILMLQNLSIIYKLTSSVSVNPATENLVGALNALVPGTYDMKSSNIVVALFSNHTGKVRLSGLSIDYIPPDHPAIIERRVPEDQVAWMDENTTMEFCITASDPYNYPMNTTWTVNGKTVLKDMFNFSWYADFDANGTYNVTVSLDNGLQKVATSWKLIVRNVNRKPVIDSFDPDKNFAMDENSSATFVVTTSDPDKDTVTYDWYMDGKRVTSEEPSYEYKTSYFSAGKHEAKVTIWDTGGASTVMAWTVTVNNVNAAPEITDWSPMLDEVAMNENSAKKFNVTDRSIDGDKQVILWYVDGISTGATGRSYEYSASFDSAGRHEVTAVVSDGKLEANRTWYVTVVDVNRPPVAVISSPAAGAEFMAGDEIVLVGNQSSDPDGDQLTMTWSETQKTLGTGATLAVKLPNGKHSITLSVDDGRKNGTASATVQITVKYLDFSGKLTVDTQTPVEGKNIKLAAVLTNKGDGSIDELLVSFRVDGTEVSTTTIDSVEPGIDFPLEFQWKAVKGNHTLEVSVNNQNFSKTVTVAKKPAAVAAQSADLLIPMLAITIVVIVAAVAGVAVFAGKKKKGAVPPKEEPEGHGEPEAAVVRKPVKKAPAAPPSKPAPAAAAAAALPAPQAPAASDETRAKEAIDNTEKLLQDAEEAGLETSKARELFKIARNFQGMGRHQKAIEFSKKAEDSIE
jgi:hypothetical protein